MQIDQIFLQQNFQGTNDGDKNSFLNYHLIYLDLLEQQRKLLNKVNTATDVNEDLIRKYLSLIDLEEYKLRQKSGQF